jgi:hypothetical protein
MMLLSLTPHLFTFALLLAAKERLLNCSRGRCYRDHSQRLSIRRSFDDDARASAVLTNEVEYLPAMDHQMMPMSETPLLLLQSSTPIISREECLLLGRYFDQLTDVRDTNRLDEVEIQIAETLLCEVHDVIDKVTNCPRHDGEMKMPRYVRYDSVTAVEKLKLHPNIFRDILLPDGCHVDTNNGKLFRHITAILYLTENDGRLSLDEDGYVSCGGGTTFPLGIPFGEKGTSGSKKLQDAATNLLKRDIHHTKGDESHYAEAIDNAAFDIFKSHVVKQGKLSFDEQNGDTRLTKMKHSGIRVMPSMGKLIYFHNVDDDGFPDPTSFHCGEEVVTLLPNSALHIDLSQSFATTKRILVFFKEIPIKKFLDGGRKGFAEQAKKARSWTKTLYYPKQNENLSVNYGLL